MYATWSVTPGMWQGWFHVYRNGICLGQFPGYDANNALVHAISRQVGVKYETLDGNVVR